MNIFSTGIVLSQAHWLEMEADVASRPIEEACGFVIGEGNQAKIIVPIKNMLHEQYRFRMDPAEELNAFVVAEESGGEILAVYHSHPHGIDRPSATDISELTFPGIIYLIWFQAFGKWQCRAYLMQNEADPIEVPVIISTNLER